MKNLKRVKIRLENVNGDPLNDGLLSEIFKDTRLKYGTVIKTAYYIEKNGACYFTAFNVIKIDCVAYVNKTCVILETFID